MEQVMSSGMAYAYILLEKWDEIIKLSEEYRQNLLSGRADRNLQNQLIAKLTRLWLELYQKIAKRSEFGDLPAQYESFRPYYEDPGLLLQDEYADDIFKLEELLRATLEKLKVTEFEGDPK